MKVMILAAGRGARLMPLTNHTPKPLVKVKGKPLLLHHINQLTNAGYHDFVINVCWLKQQIIDYANKLTTRGIKIQISDEGDTALETGGGMLKALPLLSNQPFLAVNADIYTDFDFKTIQPLNPESWVHLLLVKNPPHNLSGDFGLNHDRLTLKQDAQPSYTYSGIGLFHPKLFNNIITTEPFSVVPLIKNAIANNKATAQLHHGNWSDVGSKERLDELNAEGC